MWWSAPCSWCSPWRMKPSSPPMMIFTAVRRTSGPLLRLKGSGLNRTILWRGYSPHSDVVVVGRLVSVEGGRVFGTPNPLLDHPEESQFFFASIQVESLQLLRGAPILDSDGYIVLEELLPERSRLDTLVTNLPEGRAVFFLRNKGVDAMSQGRSRAIVERDTPFYRRITPQGVLRDIGGDVHIPVDGGGGFLLTLEGTGFDALLKRLETLPS